MITPLTAFVVGGIALVIFGPKQLPELAKGLGKAIGEFKKGINNIDEPTPPAAPPAAPPPPAGPSDVPKA